MANYYPLIAKAVAGLEKNTGETRRTLYERARGALVNQLRSVNPPLSESDITRERLALEEAIRKVEAEAVRRARVGAAPAAPERPPGEPPAGRPTEPGAPPPSAPPDARALSRPAPPEAPSAPPPSEPELPQEPPRRRFRLRPPPSQRESAPSPGGAAEPSLAARRDAEPGPPPHAETADHSFVPKDREPPPSRVAAEEPEPAEQPFPARPEEPPRQRRDIAETAGALASTVSRQLQAFAANRRLMGAAAIVLIALVLSGLLYSQWSTISGLFQRQETTTATPAQPEATTPSARSKITDRIGAPGQTRPQAGPAAAQRVVLYEEDPSVPSGKRFVGTAIWRTEQVAAGPGQAGDVVVRADIEIPEPKIAVKWSLRRNTDKALPASHTIEIVFSSAADSPNGAIANIPGILMKQAEQTRGAPLAGLAVKVTNGFFLIGLSSAEADVQRNIQLLKERSWFDVPVVYANGRRAILAIEKGAAGERAFAEAFAAWGE